MHCFQKQRSADCQYVVIALCSHGTPRSRALPLAVLLSCCHSPESASCSRRAVSAASRARAAPTGADHVLATPPTPVV